MIRLINKNRIDVKISIWINIRRYRDNFYDYSTGYPEKLKFNN
jgi:hypothetical protein